MRASNSPVSNTLCLNHRGEGVPLRGDKGTKVALESSSLAIHRVTTPDAPDFHALVAIYTAAHPPSERKPVTHLAAMIQRPGYLFQVVTLEQKVVGFAIVLLFPQSDACLLEYMAIAPEHQAHGLGQFLFKHLAALPEIANRYLLAEVDSDKIPGHPDRTRRKNFYRRLGAREVGGLDYIMPPVSSSTPPPMDIMVYRHDLPQQIPNSELRAWLQSIYVNVYAQQPNDPRIDKMIQHLPENLPLI
jgi:ribosomal protein S18 acetylase RimI-like enzyme